MSPMPGTGMAGRRRRAPGRGGGVRVAPESDMAVMCRVTDFEVVLVRTRKPGDTPPAVDWPVQYQADDSASGAPTSAPGIGAAPDGRRCPPHGHGDADAGDDEHDEGGDAPPALAAVMAGVTT